MIEMDKKVTIKVLRRQGHSIADIVKSVGLSRNTVRRVLRSPDIEHTPAKYRERGKQYYPQLQPYIEGLNALLEHDEALPKKEKRTARRYYTNLQAEGYQGSYDAIRRYVKKWNEQRGKPATGAYIPLEFDPGEAYQFDWSTEWVELADKKCQVKVAHFRLCYSRKFFIVAYLRESHEMLFDAHDQAFAFFGGVTNRGIYDNMKTAVDKVFTSKNERKYNAKFLCLMSHYEIDGNACNPAAGWEKGQVENQVDNVRDWIFKPRLKFKNLDELNNHLKAECVRICKNSCHPDFKDKTIEQVFVEEMPHLRAVDRPFNGYHECDRVVKKTCLDQLRF